MIMEPMIANDELRRNWRRNWLGSVQELADIDTQRRLWLDLNVRNRHYSFVECLSCYFDGMAKFVPCLSGPHRHPLYVGCVQSPE